MEINTGFNANNSGNPAENKPNAQDPLERDPLILELQRSWKSYQTLQHKTDYFTQREGIASTFHDSIQEMAAQQFNNHVRELLARDYSHILNASASEERSRWASFGQSESFSGKHLCRIEKGKTIAGVCTGVADYFKMDLGLIRVGFILASLIYGMGIIAYIALLLILPVKATPQD